MDTPNAAPSTPAAPAAPAVASTPAAPATPSTPATPPAAAPESGAQQPDNRSTEQILRDKLSPMYSKDGVGGELDPNYNPETGTVDKATDAEAAESKEIPAGGEEAAKEPAAQLQDPNDPFKDFSVEPESQFGPDVLAKTIEADPALSAALESNPEAKAAVFANARKAERAAKYDELLGSPAEAAVVVEGHTNFLGVSERINAISDENPQSLADFTNSLLDLTVLRDDQGNPLKNADGSLRTSGVVGRLYKNVVKNHYQALADKATKDGDDQALSAIDYLMERSGLRPSTAGNEEGWSEEMKAQRAALDTEKAEIARTRQEQYKADESASAARVDSHTDSYLDRAMSSIMSKATGITDDFTKTNVERGIRKELRVILAGGKSSDGQRSYQPNRAYLAERNAIEARALGPGREKALKELNQRAIEEHLPRAARAVFKVANQGVISRVKDKLNTQAEREEAARSETQSAALPPANPGAAPQGNASIEQVTKDLTQKYGRSPSTEDILRERMTRLSAQAAPR